MKHTAFYDGRIKFLAMAVLVLMALFVMRLFYLQVIQHDMYTALAQSEQLRRLEVPAERGEIYAMNHDQPVKLVLNENVYTVFADPKVVKDKQKIADVLARIAGGEARPNIKKILDSAKEESRYEILARNVTRKQAELIKKEELSGIGFQQETRRVYPEGQLAAQTLGFVNAEGEGQYGIEQSLNDRLTGKDGMLQTVADVSNVPLTIGKDNIRVEPQNGEDVVLSIDRNVQSYVEDTLKTGLEKAGAKTGSVIVMNPRTGHVLAMANYPTYNPNEYNKVTDAAAFTNGTISLAFEPASVIKTIMMATGIDQGVINRGTTYTNTDSVQIEDATINNALKGMTGTRTMQEAYNWSLNTGTVFAAQQLGGGRINDKARRIMYEYYHDRFGLGEATGIELAGESDGRVVSPDETEGNAVRYSNMTFGQGLNITMVQVAAAFSSIVNGGEYYKPTVLAGKMEDGVYKPSADPSALRQTVSAATSAEMRKMAVEGRKAFFESKRDREGYTIGGKTGTSQQIQNGKYVFNETIGTYLGFGGTTDPEYVIMVQVAAPNKKMEGGIHAGPIFTDISNWLIDYLKLQPKE